MASNYISAFKKFVKTGAPGDQTDYNTLQMDLMIAAYNSLRASLQAIVAQMNTNSVPGHPYADTSAAGPIPSTGSLAQGNQLIPSPPIEGA
jgi:hypothetical protein